MSVKQALTRLPSMRSVAQLCAASLTALLALSGCSDDSTSTPASTPASYTLSGTVSGLNATGLALAVNGSTVPVSSGATSVALASDMSSGTAYAVTVRTQPAGETCTVAAGSGTIASANVANVVVTCADQAYSLGGSVSGLNGSGLVLANGTDTLSVALSATSFTMPTRVAYTSSYAVTVKTQPAGVACAVTRGTGTMPAVAVTSVAVSCTDQPFSLGGTVTNSPGLTLVNAGNGDRLAIPGAAGSQPFTMGMKVPYASAYALQATLVPAGQTCTVSNGAGSMGTANIANVAVSCSQDTYTIGGSITGLAAGDTLVISNSNGDSTTIDPAQSTYTMTRPIAYGSGYALTVTNPANKICTLVNASGSNVQANVTDANVTCGPSSYTVGGTIAGLGANTGLVLVNNGGDATTIAANATHFTMTTGVAPGAAYDISVQSQPALTGGYSPVGVQCTVTGGTGTANAEVESVAINCRALAVVTFTTAGNINWTVPAGVTTVTVIAVGAGGGAGISAQDNSVLPGGNGGKVTAQITVSAGDTLALAIGSGGTGADDAPDGAGGGASTNVVDSGNASNLIIGGGGGGGDGFSTGGNGANGAGPDTAAGGSSGGGFQGGANGIGGSSAYSYGTGGNGSGGSGGDAQGVPGGVGTGSGTGGQGYYSGGGGGGYGGGAAGNGGGGGGGGGSTGPASASFDVANNGGNANSPNGGDGSVTILY